MYGKLDILSSVLYTPRCQPSLTWEGEQMAYEEKGAWSYLVVTVGAYAAYLLVILGRERPLAEVSYIPAMLWTIGGAILAPPPLPLLFSLPAPNDAEEKEQRG